MLASTALGCALAVPGLAYAQTLPTGGSVAAGSVAIAQPSATQLNITQSSQSAVVNWQGFSIGQGSAVNIAQPNASSAILNRVTGSTPSTIAGSLTANGQVYLVNPNGIAITKSGTVNVGGGFVASTLGIADDDFMSGRRSFSGNGASARVSNAGVITVGRGGYAALIGGTVSNSGSISVPLGKVGLGSGERATLDFAGDGFLQVAMPTNAGGKGAQIKNSGSLRADGGSIIISAATAREAARSAINISGLVQARSIGGRSGSIIIGGGAGGKVRITGRLIANSRHASGGTIQVTGKDIKLKGATVDASGATGGGNINIGGGRQGSGTLQHADTTTIDAATTIKADATQSGNGGNVVVWSDLLTTFAGTISAKGGPLDGNGGEAEVSGKAKLAYTGFTDLSAVNGAFGTLLLDPYNVTISNAVDANQSGFTATGNDSVINVTTLQNALALANVIVTTDSGGGQAGDVTVAAPVSWSANSTLTLSAYRNITFNSGASITHTGSGGGLVLRADITGTGAGTVQFASAGQVAFSGGGKVAIYYNPTGDGTTVNGTKYISATQTNFSGNVTLTGGATLTTSMLVNTATDLQNVQNNLNGRYALGRDIDAGATSGWNSGAGFVPIGTLSANFTGVLDGQGHTISNLTINRPTTDDVGLFGYTNGVLITDVGLVGGSVTGRDVVGGLVGLSTGGSTVQRSYSTGNVNGGLDVGGLIGSVTGGVVQIVQQSYATGRVSGRSEVGGLVGFFRGSLDESYATGDVSATGRSSGGLIGNFFSGSVQKSYATGAVSGDMDVGGLVGISLGSVGVSYATGAVSGNMDVGGLVGSNLGTVSQTYATGSVTGSLNVGGLVGINGNGFIPAANQGISVQQSYATGAVVLTSIPDFQTFNKPFGALIGLNFASVSGSYWNTDTSGQTVGIGSGSNFAGGVGNRGGTTGLTSAQMMQQSSFSGFDFGSTWRIYEGHTVPLLKFFLTPLTVTLNGGDITKTYDGQSAAFTGSATFTGATSSNGSTIVGLNGTLGYDNAVNFGTYAVDGLWSTTYDISFAGANPKLTITPRPVTVTVSGNNKVYDGTTSYAAPSYTFTNVLTGDTLGVIATVAFADKNVGTGKLLSASNASLTGNVHGNYALNSISGTANITAATLTVSGASAAGKVYDGTTAATVSGGSLSGLINGDIVTLSQSGAFSDKNAGTGKTVSETFGLGGTDVGNYVLASSTATTTASITAATLTASGASAAGKVYDGTTAATVSGGSLSGLINGDTVALSQSGSFDTKNVGAAKTVTATFGLSGVDAGNYVLASSTATTTASITAATLTASGANAAGKVYDGTIAAAVSGGSLSGLINGDTVALSQSGSFDTKNVGAAKTVTETFGLGGTDAGNYVLASSTATTTASITAATLTASGASAAGKVYDGTTAAAVSGGSLSGLINGDTVALSQSGSFDTKNVGAAKTVTETFGLGGTDAGNYVLASSTATTTASITVATLTASGASAAGKVYDGTTAATVSGGSLSGLINGDTVALSQSGSFDTKNAGTGKTVSETFGIWGTDASNYTLASTTATATANILQAQLAVTATGVNRVYDATTGAAVTLADNRITGDSLTLNYGSAAFADKNAGAGKMVSVSGIGVTGADAGNYTFNTTTSTMASITQRSVAVTGVAGVGKTYDGTSADSLSGAAVLAGQSGSIGLIATDSVVLGSSGISASFADKNAGTNKTVTASGYTISGIDAGNYVLVQPTGLTASISARSLTVSATGANRVYDATTGATVTLVDNHIAGDSLTLGYGSASFADKNVGVGKAVSVSGITVGGTGAGNYTFNTTATTTASIAQAALTFDAVSATKIYDGTTASPATPLVSGLRGADTVSGLSQSYDSGNVGSHILSVNGGYAINDGNAGANYTLTIGSAVAGSITPRPISVVADAQSRVVSDPNPPLTYAVGGFGLVIGDTLSGGLATAATTQSVAGSYAITQGSLAASSNYALSYVGADLTVTPAPVVNNSPVNPVVVSSPAYQPPKVSSINFVTASYAPGSLVAFTRSSPTRTAARGTEMPTQTAAAPEEITTGSLGKSLATSSDGLIYQPISQYDAVQYSDGKLPDYADRTGLATILTMIARTAGRDKTPTIDHLFDPAKGADWRGVGWQNPLTDKVTFAVGPQATEPNAASALPLDGTTDLGALLGRGPVVLAGAGGISWLLATVRTEDGIVANDPATGLRVLLGYNPETHAVGPISRILGPGGTKWMTLADAASAGLAFVDDAKIAALKTFAAEKYLAVILAK